MNTESVKTKFEADVTGFITPVTQAMATIEKMIAKMEKMGATGNQVMQDIANAAREGMANFAAANWSNPMARRGGGNPFDASHWENFLGGFGVDEQARLRANRVTSSLATQRAMAMDEEQQRRNRVQSGLAAQRVQEDERRRRQREQRMREQEREQERQARLEEQERQRMMRAWSKVGTSAFAGGAAGFLSGNPVSGLFGGLITGAFTGGPAGAIAGGAAGLLGGVAGMGVDLLKEGLGAALNITKELVVETVKLGMEYQRNVAYFSAFAGGKAGGTALMSSLQDIAVSSPFKLNQLTGPASLLLGYGISPTETPAAVGRLSMIAGGDAGRLERLALAYAQVQSHGRFMGQELRQFAEAGVGAPDFARTLGVDTHRFRQMMANGEVGADVVTRTLNSLTGPGGRYQDVNNQLLGSVEGRVNQLVETVQIKLGKLGARLFERFDIGGKIEGITNAVGPLADKWLPVIENALERIFDLGGRVFQPLIANFQLFGEAVKIWWQSPVQKMFLPQTWDDVENSVLGLGLAFGMLTGAIGDMARATAIAQPYLIATAQAATGNYAGAAATLSVATSGPGAAEFAKFIDDPFKMAKAGMDPWVRATIDLAKQRQAGRRNGWDWLGGGSGGGGKELPELTVSRPLLSQEAQKFIDGFTKSQSKGGDNALDKFEEDLNRITSVTMAGRRLAKIASTITGGGGLLTMPFGDLFLGEGGTDEARYQAYLKLKGAVHLNDSFRLPQGAMADTVEAVKTVLESSYTPGEQDPQTQIKNVLEEANKQREKQLKELEELNKFLKDNPVVIKPKKV